MESDDEEAEEVASVDTMRSASSMRRGGKRMDMIRPHLTQQQQEAADEEGLYSESDQEVETQSRSSAMQVCGQSLSAINNYCMGISVNWSINLSVFLLL